jgi:curli biogenesis system outer membrane secretion channel CsgG
MFGKPIVRKLSILILLVFALLAIPTRATPPTCAQLCQQAYSQCLARGEDPIECYFQRSACYHMCPP